MLKSTEERNHAIPYIYVHVKDLYSTEDKTVKIFAS